MLIEQTIVPLSRIDRTDNFFRVSTRQDCGSIAESIQAFGLINPPIAAEGSQPGTYQIVSGLGRIRALAFLSRQETPVRLLPPDTPLAEKCRIAVADKAGHRALNLVEQARALALLSNAAAIETELIALAGSAGIHVNSGSLAKLLQINRMPAVMQKGLIDGAIALPMALRLFQMSDTVAAAVLVDFLIELNLSLNRQRELLDWLEAVSIRDRIRVPDLLNSDDLLTCGRSDEPDQVRRSACIREKLRHRRYPEISAAQQRFSLLLKTLNLPSQMKLVPPPFFEGQHFLLQVNFQTPEELSRLLEQACHLSTSPKLKQVLTPF